MVDVMVDLESLGVGMSPMLFQLGAVAFKLDSGAILSTYEEKIKPNYGCDVDSDTFSWWMEQDKETIETVLVPAMVSGKPIKTVLESFNKWLKSLGSEPVLWGNGIFSDNVWMANTYEKAEVEWPFSHRSHRDVRTLMDMTRRVTGKDARKSLEFLGTQHDALDDCRHQITYCHKAYLLLSGQLTNE